MSIVIKSGGLFQYILTLTLYEHLSSFKRVGLKIPSRDEIDQIEGGLRSRIEKVFKNTKYVVEVIKFSDFCDEIVSAAKDIKLNTPDAVVISTTSMITYDTGGTCIGLSRLIDINGDIIDIGSRAGCESVEKQINRIARDLNGRRAIIIEDGSFTGNTLCHMLKRLSDSGVQISAVVMGILFPDAKTKLENSFKGQLICGYQFENPFDWMPSHDFFPFIPNSGRVLGTRVGDSLIPVHLFDRSTLSKPYILPYGKLDKWAGLPISKGEMTEFSHYCIRSTIEIFQKMEILNQKRITIGDIINTRPITSVPVAFGQNKVDFFNLGDRVVDVLDRDCSSLYQE